MVGTSNKRAKHINGVEQRTQESALMYMVTGSSNKGFKTTEQGKDSLLTYGAGKTGHPCAKQ